MECSSRRLLLAVSAIAVSLVAVLARHVGEPSSTFESTSSDAHASVPGATFAAEIELFSAKEPVVAPRRSALPPAPIAIVDDSPAPTPVGVRGSGLRPGRLAVQVLDSATCAPLKGVRIRAVDATRVADRTAGRRELVPVLRLSPRDYALYVSAPGYEPAEIAAVRIVAGETTTPAPIYLVPGTARISGRVDPVPATGTAWRAELIGEGRRPCPRCEREPCPHCGFAPEQTRIALATDGSFAFERLASAVYLLRIVDADHSECSTPVRVDLQPADARYVVLAPAPPRTIRIALEDSDGASLADAWAARVAHHDESVDREFSLDVDDRNLSWDLEFEGAGELVGVGSFVAPAPAGTSYSRPYRTRCGGCGRGTDRDDRRRQPGEELRPVPSVPRFATLRLEPIVDARGHVVIVGVPARIDRVELELGRFAARVRVDSADDRLHRTRIAVTEGGYPSTFREYEATLVDERARR